MLTAGLVIAASGLVNLLIVLLVGGIIAAVAYYILGLFLPHPIPVLVAALIMVVVLITALGSL